MRIKKQIIKIGDSMGVILDKSIINGHDIKIGDEIEIDIKDGKVELFT